MIWVRISHTIAPLPTVEADAPKFDHGDTEESPRPVPNASRISANEVDTNAPPITAAQDTPDEYASLLLDDRNFEMSHFDQTLGVHNSMVEFGCGRITNRRRSPMSIFMILFVVLLVAWLLGLSVFHVAGGFIHILLIVAVISLIIHFVRGRTTSA